MYQGTFSPTSNQQTWTQAFEVTDADTGDAINLSAATITFEVHRQSSGSNTSIASFFTGTSTPTLQATVGSGITITDTGVFEVSFTRTQMQTLTADDYDVGCVLTNQGETTQLLIAVLPVLDGVVTS